MRYRVFATAFGRAAVAWRDDAITSLRLPAESVDEAERAVRSAHPNAVPGDPPVAVAAAIEAIECYFAGEAVDFADVALDLGSQPHFAARVYTHVRALGRGETTTYGAVARALGDGPEGARAVGRAMATNPVPLIIPCHRVLGQGGALVGFSAPGGTGTKARMLALERAAVAEQQAFAS